MLLSCCNSLTHIAKRNKDVELDCINCLHSFRTEKKLKPHENVCKNLDYYHIAIPEKDNIILKYNHREKPVEGLFPIYADRDSLLE